MLVIAISAMANDQEDRKVKTASPPEYPELARRLNLHGPTRVRIVVAPDGSVKGVKEVSGHPVLLQALVLAVRRWKYEPSGKTTIIEVRYDFGPE